MSIQDLTFKEMADYVIGERFDEAQREEVKQVLNVCYGLAFNSQQWDFRHTEATVAVNAGDPVLQSVPVDLGPIEGLVNERGFRLEYATPRQFTQYAQGLTTDSEPAIYTRFDNEVRVAPTPSQSSPDWVVAYERRLTYMILDSDTPVWPAEHRYGVLVQGARAQMLAGENDPTYDTPQQYTELSLTACVRDYISDRRFTALQYGRDTLNSGWAR